MSRVARVVVVAVMSLGICFLGSRPALSAADSSSSECQSLISSLLPCLPYVQGQAALPSKDCCTSVLPIHQKQPQCLCQLILAAADHSPNLPDLSVNLSMSLGPACNIDTDPSRCPSLLNLAPGSADAKIFPTSPASNSSSTGATPSTVPKDSPSKQKMPPSLGGSPSTPSSLSSSSGSMSTAALVPFPLLATALLGVSLM